MRRDVVVWRRAMRCLFGTQRVSLSDVQLPDLELTQLRSQAASHPSQQTI